MTEQEEREAFEVAADKLLLSGNAREIGWQAWQARASLAQSDAPRCVACGETIKTGDIMIEDITEGPMHAACCGPDRDAYAHLDDGSPLEDGEPIPTGEPYYPDTPETRLAFAAGSASVAQAGKPAPTGYVPVHPDVLRRLGDPELMKRTIGKFSPALAEKMGFTPEEEKALEALYHAFEGFDLPCAPPAQVGVDAAGVSKAAADVLAERRRQVEVEGWTPSHDDEHTDGEMAVAAGCYAMDSGAYWPMSWDYGWWKPKDRRQNLVRAGALIIAEIERLDRAALPAAGTTDTSKEG